MKGREAVRMAHWPYEGFEHLDNSILPILWVPVNSLKSPAKM